MCCGSTSPTPGPERQAETIDSIRGAAETVGREVAILGDLPGPKLRIGSMRGDVVELDAGTTVTLTPDGGVGDEHRIPVSWAGLSQALGPDELVYLADGAIRLRVLGIGGRTGSSARSRSAARSAPTRG